MRTRRSVRTGPALAGVLLATALAVTGCGGADDSGGSADDKAASQANGRAGGQEGAKEGAKGGARDGAPGGSADGAGATAPPRTTASHIIRTASLTVRVEDVPKALAEARSTTENAGGYVGTETTTRDDDGDEHTRVVLRVPVAAYEEVLAGLEGTGKLLERHAKAEDVTEQVVDVESRITTQRASVARIRELMDRATKLSDVVTLEGELSTRQADLEALLARQASLKDRTSLATITLSLSETAVKKDTGDDEPGFVDALAGGWEAFLTMLRWLAVAFGALLPFAVVGALLLLLWLKVVRPRTARRAEHTPAVTTPGILPYPRPATPPATSPAAGSASRSAPRPAAGTREGGEE
ncbi:DUF4349 domain-containing protein [Streptomyces sp. NPDC005931]|uniref:DUF4349 domain-containing protein n=1 Tax=Streptomyces sp. NPDC005931 TaxID=3364737 RepID=UPI0036737C14